MKRRIPVVALSVALVLLLALPVITPAASSGTTVITGSISAVISSVSPNAGVQGNSYSNVIISGTDFISVTSVSFGPDITVSYIVNSETQITATVTVSSTAVAGSRDVTVTAAGVSAVKTGGFSVTAVSFSITAPSAFSLGNMVRGQTAKGHSSTPGTVSTNAGSWTVVAKDSNASGTKGYMLNGGSAHLTNQLRIGKTLTTCSTNAGDLTGLVYSQADGTSIPLYVEQDIDAGDPIGAYSITIAFVGSAP
jgi:hypothetical protein